MYSPSEVTLGPADLSRPRQPPVGERGSLIRDRRQWLRILPRGGGISEVRWWRRHQGILILLWVHAAAIPVYGVIRGFSFPHVVLEGLVIAVPAVAATVDSLPRRARTVAAAVGLLSSSAVLVHLSGGLIEMHFHFFVMVAVVAMYHDWLAFLLSILYVLVHHGVMGALDPGSVFNHPAAINHPWKWAGVHAFFIAGISAALLTYWRLNESYLDERKRAERRARREARTVAALNEIGKSLTGDLDLSHLIQKVTDAATELTAAAYGAFFYNVDGADGGSYELYTLSGAPREAFDGFPTPRNTALFAATFSGTGIVRCDDITTDPRYGKNAPHYGMPEGHLPVRSYLAIPVVSRGKVLGGLFLGHPQAGRFGYDDERLAVGIAAHAAAAIEVATLFESERRARERLATLAEAGRVLGSSLDLETMMRSLAELVVPGLADAFVADVFDEGGVLRRLAVRADPRVMDVRSVPAPAPPDLENEANPIVRAIRGGRSELIEEVPSGLVDAAIADAAYRETVKRLSPTSAIIVPLVHRDRVAGAFTFGTVRASGRRLGPDDKDLAEQLARRSALAVENAILFARQRDTAEVLQHALLPEDLPDMPGLSAAARYVAGGPGVEVGGDWYDALTLQDGSIALVMGDVVGHGLAAATLMGQLKSALRAYSLDGYEPAEVLQRLNAMLHELGPGDQMATLVYCRFDPSTGVLRVANAGHLPPLILAPDGARYFEEPGGMPLGAVARAKYVESVAAVPPGSVILLYTDGLVEDRHTPLDTGMANLKRIAAQAGTGDLDALCESLIAAAPAGSRDDIAILALRWHVLGDRLALQLPTRAAILKPLRATLRRWLKEAGTGEQETYEILAAMGEAVTNVIRHAGGSAAPSFELEAERGDGVRLVIRDRGQWRPEDRSRPGGHGLRIMREFMDSVEVTTEPTGTAVTLSRSAGLRGR